MFGTWNYICHCPWYIWLLLIWLLLLMLVFHEWDLKIPRPDALHVSMYTVREHQTRVNCQTRILYLCYTSGLCLCLCHKNIPRYKYTDHMIYMYIICIIWNAYFTINTFYLVICSIVPPILKYNSNPISEKTLAEMRVFKSDKSGILSARIPGSYVLNV